MYTGRTSHGGADLAEAVRALYNEGQSDYSLEPVILTDIAGVPVGRIEDHDAVIFCCRRGERETQLTEAFVDERLEYFPRKKFSDLPFVILTLYHEKFKDQLVAFAPSKIHDTLAETLSRNNLRQLHLSESEKYSHVTFFLNGGNNQPFGGETDVRIPSQKGIAPEQNPELSLSQVTDQLYQGLKEGYDFIVVNFANGDVIGHTQNREAKIKCAEWVDAYLGKTVAHALEESYLVIVTADHGNLEELYTPEGNPHVSHTANLVPLILITPCIEASFPLQPGILADIAPTILSIYGLDRPGAMTGDSLVPVEQCISSKRILLIILDGWGIGKQDETNPIHLAHTPTWDELLSKYPHTCLRASGEAAGLQAGKAGNSEAGHMNIGAGRLVLQDDMRLDIAMQDGSFYTNEIFMQTLEGVKQRHSRLHLIGLLSEKSSHGSLDYPLALLRMAKEHGLREVYVHLIFDGRSTQPGSAPAMLEDLEQKVAAIGIGKIVTGVGRSLALDRDGNYHKTKAAYDALVYGIGRKFITNWPGLSPEDGKDRDQPGSELAQRVSPYRDHKVKNGQ
jgi:2,3-bisphosphoglycerate-independent phosphoglycerate mutase